LFPQLVMALGCIDGSQLGSFAPPRLASPRPDRAKALALVLALTPDAPIVIAGFDRALALAKGLDDPDMAGVATPDARQKIEIVQQAVTTLRPTVLAELGPQLDVGIGFNAADGD
jgi:hypothetical protein